MPQLLIGMILIYIGFTMMKWALIAGVILMGLRILMFIGRVGRAGYRWLSSPGPVPALDAGDYSPDDRVDWGALRDVTPRPVPRCRRTLPRLRHDNAGAGESR